jgi:2-polyprenyl-3-methyl-5-hydroxy-6-metoxy-1,4-benzoquinol methylase
MTRHKKILCEDKIKIEKRYGGWTDYIIVTKGKKIYLTDYPKKKNRTSLHYFEKIVNFAGDTLKTPLSKARVLDLACSEGIASFAFSTVSKSVLGIEGRRVNLVKARSTKKLLGLKNVNFRKADVRNLCFPDKSFEVILALGILYHLDVPDLFRFIENLYRWTNEIVVIDTHISFVPKVKQTWKGKDYFGIYYDEFVPNETTQSSIGNKRSFWLTRNSLMSILKRVGFKEIYECKLPKNYFLRQEEDRLTLVAVKRPRFASPLFRTVDIKKFGYNESDTQVLTLQYNNYRALEEEINSYPK